jgi:putative tricarboxylic transport membrane protein
MAPMVLGVVLGNMMEQNLRRALSITNGEIGILFESKVSIALWIAAVLVSVGPILLRRIAARKQVHDKT